MTLETIYVVTSGRLNALEGGYSVYLFASDNLVTTYYDGSVSKTRPCIDGDVLSIDPNGTMGGRPMGTSGPYEVAKKTSKGLLYSPLGHEGKSFLVPYAE